MCSGPHWKIKRKRRGGGVMPTVLDRPKALMPLSDAVARQPKRSDWEELSDRCYAIAQRKGMTDEDIKEAIKRARTSVNGHSR